MATRKSGCECLISTGPIDVNFTQCSLLSALAAGSILSACGVLHKPVAATPVAPGAAASDAVEGGSASAGLADAPWSYASGPTGPQHWGHLKPEFRLCADGRNQSPVDLSGSLQSNLPRLTPKYRASSGHEWVYNEPSLQLNVKPGSVLSVGRHDYALKHVQFHRPSEHRINGLAYPMEVQLVHADTAGNLAVMAVLVDAGKPNNTIKALWKAAPKADGTNNPSVVRAPVSLAGLWPGKRDYFEYPGSLTTPPCTENVRWLVFKQPLTLSAEQLQGLASVLKQDNARPVQPLSGRAVLD